MKRKLATLLAACLLLLACAPLALPVLAAGESFAQINGRVVDGADLIPGEKESGLEARLNTIAEEYSCDVVIVTTPSLDGADAQAYADDFYDYNGYGIGKNRDGILLLVSMQDRDWAFSTSGFGITAFTERALDDITETIVPYMKDGEFYDAFVSFAGLAEDFIYAARNRGQAPENITYNIIISVLIGVAAAAAVTLILKAQLKTVRPQQLAHEYIRPGSFQVTGGSEMFLYRNVSRTAIPKTDNSSGGHTHVGSSGGTHGGRSGKF